MKNKKGLLVIILVLAAILAAAGIAYAALGAGGSRSVPTLAANSSSNAAETDAAKDKGGDGKGEEESSTASEGSTKLADFTIETLDGETTTLSSVYGKPAIVGFWATWCPPCNQEAPAIQKLYETYGDQVNFMMINSASDGRDTVDGTKEWLAAGNYTYPVYIDKTGEAAMAAQVYYLPTMYVLDKEGNVLTAFSGALDEKSGTDLLEQLIAL